METASNASSYPPPPNYSTATQPPPYPPPYSQGQVVNPDVSPGLAFLLGLIPGVGAIYNAQYAKGLIHAVVFGFLISIADNHDLNGGFEGVFVMLSLIWFAYMPFEAMHTAKRRSMGQPVDEFSSLIRVNPGTTSAPVGPIVLIGAGVFFLLANFNLVRMSEVVRFWPVALIAAGAYLLYGRVKGAGPTEPR